MGRGSQPGHEPAIDLQRERGHEKRRQNEARPAADVGRHDAFGGIVERNVAQLVAQHLAQQALQLGIDPCESPVDRAFRDRIDDDPTDVLQVELGPGVRGCRHGSRPPTLPPDRPRPPRTRPPPAPGRPSARNR